MKETVHVLLGGFARCGFSSRVPMHWPEGHFWVGVSSAVDPNLLDVNCPECAAIISQELSRG